MTALIYANRFLRYWDCIIQVKYIGCYYMNQRMVGCDVRIFLLMIFRQLFVWFCWYICNPFQFHTYSVQCGWLFRNLHGQLCYVLFFCHWTSFCNIALSLLIKDPNQFIKCSKIARRVTRQEKVCIAIGGKLLCMSWYCMSSPRYDRCPLSQDG